MSLLIVLFCIVLLVLLITLFHINAFLAFLIVSSLAGLLLGMPVDAVMVSVQKGLGDMLGALVIIIVTGAMLGKIVAESGAAQRITTSLMKLFGEKNIGWALMVTGFVIGIPLFYSVGFVLVLPLVFSVAYQYKLPVVYIGLPMFAALSVTHGFLPPHPSPTALVAQFHADMGMTLFYGFIVAVPTVIIAGPIFAKTLKHINSKPLATFQTPPIAEDQLPGMANSILSSLSPVIMLAFTTIVPPSKFPEGPIRNIMTFLSDPAVVMVLSLVIATFTLGIFQKISMKKTMGHYTDSVKDIGMIMLIIAGSGALKEILIKSGVNSEIGDLLNGINIHPLVMGWLIACVIRVCLGSATVAGLTAAGLVAPMMVNNPVDPNLMVLSIGAGSLMFSHVNDSGFWMFKEYLNLSIKDTIRSWSLMETIVAISGLIGVMALNALLF